MIIKDYMKICLGTKNLMHKCIEISGCLFHSEHGLLNFEHPTKKMKAMPRIDSEGVMCGANFNVDSQSRNQMMPRVGSEANWSTWG
jgi:hypothetical protein